MDIKSSMSSLRTSSNRSLGSDLAANVSGSSRPFFMYSAALILPRLNPSSRRQPSDMTYAAKMMPLFCDADGLAQRLALVFFCV